MYGAQEFVLHATRCVSGSDGEGLSVIDRPEDASHGNLPLARRASLIAGRTAIVTAALPDDWRALRLGDMCDSPRYGANASARPFDPRLPR